MNYEPFLIAPFATGLDTDVEPWQLPQDAFSDVINGHIRHGVIEKREGYTKLGDIVHKNGTNWDISAITQASPGVVTVTSTTGLTNGDIVEIRDVTGMTELNGNQYTIGNITPTTFELTNVNTTNFTAYIAGAGGVYLVPQDRVMGILQYIDSANIKEVLAFDTKRACKFDPTNDQFVPLDNADIMSGGNLSYVWGDNWASTASTAASTLYRLYFTNGDALSGGLNGIRYYNGGTTTTSFAPVINSTTTINGCKLLFAFRQRLVLLHTFEGANTYPQRARWCQAQGPSVTGGWDDNVPGKGGFVDAPTGDHIISAQFVQDVLIVYFTSSVWTLRPTSDPALPFKWDKINDFRSCDGKMTTEQFDRTVISAGIRGINATDGVGTQRIDERIEDFTDSAMNDEHFGKVFAKRSFGNRRMWMLYPRIESTEADSALIFDEESKSFSKYKIELNVLGHGGAGQDSSIVDFGDQTLDQFADDTLTDFFFDEGSEILLGGDRDGEIFVMEQGGDDQEERFDATIINVTQASPGVITMTGNIGLSDGDVITISGIAAGSMVELNDREFIVASKSGNTFELSGIDTSGYTAYVAGSAGTVRTVLADSIEFELTSAAWNPWMSQGKQAQLGYVDLFMDTHPESKITVEFFTNNENSPYSSKTMNMLPNLVERSAVSHITNANPGQVTSNNHGLSTGEEVYIYNVDGMNAVNGGPYTVTVVDRDNFTIGVDTTNYGIYDNDGVVTELPFASTKAWKRVYAGGSGYQHFVHITSEGKDKPIRIHALMPWFRPRGSRPV